MSTILNMHERRVNNKTKVITVNCVALVFVVACATIAVGPVFAVVGAAAGFVISIFIYASIATNCHTNARPRKLAESHA